MIKEICDVFGDVKLKEGGRCKDLVQVTNLSEI